MDSTINYKGCNYTLNLNDLDASLQVKAHMKDEKSFSCTWKLKDNRLYLILPDITNSNVTNIFESDNSIFAIWFTGHFSFVILTENDYSISLWVNIVEGLVSEKKIIKVFQNDYYIKFGKYKGRFFSDIIVNKDFNYLKWVIKNVISFSIPPHILHELDLNEDLKLLNIGKFLLRNDVSYNINTQLYELNNKKNHYIDSEYYLNEDYEEDDFYDYTPNINYDRDDYDRDYFDTMTDGQMGNYDDFSGTLDDIDTWSRG
jgi:uncharacterized protein (DUF3820 family)